MVMTEAETSARHSRESRLLVRTVLLEIKGRESLECHYQSPRGVRFISWNGGTGSWTGHHNGALSFFLTGSRDTDADKDGAQPWRVRTAER